MRILLHLACGKESGPKSRLMHDEALVVAMLWLFLFHALVCRSEASQIMEVVGTYVVEAVHAELGAIVT